jgi:tetratricopeptide (TPR) repeat protein
MTMNKTSLKPLAAFLAMCLLPCVAWTQAYVVVPGGNKVEVEQIRVRPDGGLVVTINGQPRDIAKDQYVQAVGIKPAGIDQAQALINQGKIAEASAILTGIVQEMRYQSWDAFAGEKLAAIQLSAGEPLEAKRTLDSLERRYGDNMITLFPFLEKVQWDVKVKSGETLGLEDELTAVLKSDSKPERKARALIVRGDVKASRKDYQAAVLDYLRAEYFFGDNPALRAEALYKTASMFAKIGDTGRLRKYSTLLKETYPDSEYSSKEIGS